VAKSDVQGLNFTYRYEFIVVCQIKL